MSTCNIILKAELPSVERELLRRFCHEMHGADGTTLLHIPGTRMDTTHAVYLEIDALLPQNAGTRTLRIPHDHVLLIEGDGKTPLAGITKTTALPDH